MTLEIDLSPYSASRLHEEAAREGQEPAAYVLALLEEHFRILSLEALRDREVPQSVEDLRPRVPTPPDSNGMSEVFGKWPGDETDEQIERALEEMS